MSRPQGPHCHGRSGLHLTSDSTWAAWTAVALSRKILLSLGRVIMSRSVSCKEASPRADGVIKLGLACEDVSIGPDSCQLAKNMWQDVSDTHVRAQIQLYNSTIS